MRSLEELLDVPAPAWPVLLEAVADAAVDVEVVPADASRAARTLVALQVAVGSTLGALAYRCGGLLVDRGWFRLLGGGSAHLPDLAAANGLDEGRHLPPDRLVVGHDALGGTFVVDGGGLGIAPGEVCYRGPDTLAYEALGVGHGGFVEAALDGRLSDRFASLRWSGWQVEVERLRPDQGLSLYPPPFTVEGRDVGAASRRAVPIAELVAFYDDAARRVT